MRRRAAASVVLTAAIFVGCGSQRKCVNEDDDDDSRSGLHVGGFALGANGIGYLTGYAAFATCDGRYFGGPRAFAVDAVRQTARTIVLEDIDPGKVVVRSDGNAAVLMTYRDPQGYQDPLVPPGFLSLDGLTPTLVPLDDALDIQPADSGVIASAGSGGSWIIDYGAVDAEQLLAQGSDCGAQAAGRLLICGNDEVQVFDSSGLLVTTLPFSDPPLFVGGTVDLGVVISGTTLAIVRDDALESTVALPNSTENEWIVYGWVSDDSRYAVVRYQQSFQLVDLTVPAVTSSIETPYFPVTDVMFSGSKAIVLTGVEMYVFDYDTGTVVWSDDWPTGGLDQIERLSESTFVVASSQNYYLRFEPGDSASRVFTLYDLSSGWGDSWDLTVEE